MALGFTDANGVYTYGEDDEIATLSAFLNLGQAAESANANGIKSRLGALEANAPVPVLTSRFSNTTTIPNGAVTATGAWANVPAFTSTGGATLVTGRTGGLTILKRGVYLVSISVGSTAYTGRNFVDFNLSSYGSYRFSWNLATEDSATMTRLVVVPGDNVTVTINSYQASGASKSFAHMLDIARVGNFS